MLGKQPDPLRVVLRQECRGAAEQRDGRGDVSAVERAPAGRREPPRAVLADRAAVLVERAELGEVLPGLLEVVAEDLLELDAAIPVDAVRPADEPLVEVGAGPLEDPVVGGVADHDVLEAVRALVAVLDGTGRGACGRGSRARSSRAGRCPEG